MKDKIIEILKDVYPHQNVFQTWAASDTIDIHAALIGWRVKIVDHIMSTMQPDGEEFSKGYEQGLEHGKSLQLEINTKGWTKGTLLDVIKGAMRSTDFSAEKIVDAIISIPLQPEITEGWISTDVALPRKTGDVKFKSFGGAVGKTIYQVIGNLFEYDIECEDNAQIAGLGSPDKVMFWKPS